MKIGVSVGATINIGNYESERIDISCEKEVPNNASREAETDKLYRELDAQLDAIVQEIKG